jgi:cysteinyl-tRNA synthetase
MTPNLTRRPLQVFNSMSRELEEFTPRTPKQARLYTCGLTVYNYAHAGNLRAYVFTDTLRRVLQFKGYDVLHVMNVTDVGHLTSDADEGADKMELAAMREGKTIWDIAAHYIHHFQLDLERLRIMPPSVLPRATEHIQEMIAFAEHCEANGYTYPLADGLYFDTSRVADYGKLALMNLEGQREGARVEPKGGRRNPPDFAVWRRSPEGKQRLMEWSSPWGKGAPGWHLECSVMSLKYLGADFDIHTGGIDHREIHHVNEIAQNQAFLGGSIGARYWMHNDFLLLGDDKMAKSGKFVRLDTIVGWGFHPVVYRYFLLAAHYRAKLSFSFDALVGARTVLLRLLRSIAVLAEKATGFAEAQSAVTETRYARGGSFDYAVHRLSAGLGPAALAWVDKLDESISRDLNSAAALANLTPIVEDGALAPNEAIAVLAIYDLVLGLGLLEIDPDALILRPESATLTADEIDALIRDREAARKSGNYKLADEIRDRLKRESIALGDGSRGTRWEWLPALPPEEPKI